MSDRRGFIAGARTIAPLLPAAGTVAATAGIAAPVVGLTQLQTIAMSVAIYFPSVMLTAIELIDEGVPWAVVVLTSLVVGIRVVILSLSIGRVFERFSTGWKWILAYFLWTPVYALTVERVAVDPQGDIRSYYLGMAVPLWVTVQLSVVAGTVLSRTVPAGLQLGFVVPLAFIVLLMRFLTDRGTKAAALVGGILAVLGAGIPLGMGVVFATIGGTIAGVIVHRKKGER